MPDPAASPAPAAPFGTSPATGPTPNAGYEAGAMQMVSKASEILTKALSMAGASSEIGQMILDFLKKSGKLIPPGTTTQAGGQNVLQQALMQHMQNTQTLQAMKQQQMSGQGGGQGAPQGAPGSPAGPASRIAA